MAATVFSTMAPEVVDPILAAHPDVAVNVLRWGGPGDRASNLILGMANWLRQADATSPEARALAEQIVTNATTIYGLPDDHERTVSVAVELAATCCGVVFDGSSLWAADGSRVATTAP